MGGAFEMKACGKRQGAALVLCIFMTAVLLSSIGVLSTRTVNHIRQGEYRAWRTAAFAGAETVLAVTKARLESGLPASVGYGGDGAGIISGRTAPPEMDNPDVTPQTLDGAPELTWYGVVGTPDGREGGLIVVVVVAEVHGVRAAIEGIYRRSLGAPELRRISWRERSLHREGS